MSDRQPERPPAYPSGVIHEIRWSEICPWLILARALRVALLVRVLVLSAIGVVITQAGWAVIAQQFSPELTMPPALRAELPASSFSTAPDRVLNALEPEGWQTGTFVSGWYWLTRPFLELGNRDHSTSQLLGHLLIGLWAVLVWALFGGAISRTTALFLTRGETLGPFQSLKEAARVWPATLGSPSITLLAAIALSVPLVLLGLLLRADLLAVVAAVVWVLVLAWGLMLAVVLLGLMIGWPLMWACLAVERSDAFDGVSRCYAYVYQRPLHLAFFVAVASGLGILGDHVVAFFAEAAVGLTEWTLSWGMGDARAQVLFGGDLEASPAPLATKLFDWWEWGIQTMADSFPVASLWVMAVGIYLLLRRLVDATEMDEIVLADGTVQSGLPTSRSQDDDATQPAETDSDAIEED